MDRVHVVRWKEPTLADIAPVMAELRVARDRLGAPVFGMALLPIDLIPPTDEVRAQMGAHLDELLEVAESLLFVIEGTGFRQAFIRSTLTAVLFLSKHRGRAFVHQQVDGALNQIRRRLNAPVPDILRQAGALGLLSSEPASQSVHTY